MTPPKSRQRTSRHGSPKDPLPAGRARRSDLENLLSELLDGMAEAVVLVSTDGLIERFNLGAQSLFGYDDGELIGQPLERLIPEASRATHRALVAALIESGATTRQLMGGRLDVRGRRADGTTFPASASISRLDLNGATRLLAIVKDETDLVRLRETERALSRAQHIGRSGSWEWDIESGDLWWSDELYRLFGHAPGDFGATYEAFLEMVHPDDVERVSAAVDAAIEGSEPYDLEHRIIRRDGSERVVRELAEVVRRDGRAARMLGVCQDITERVETEARLRQAQKMETLGTLTGGIAHDFNNLLSVILGNLDLARTLLREDDDRVAPLVGDAMKAAEKSASLVERLLAFSRRQDLCPAPLNLAELLAGLKDTLERTIGKSIEITIDAAPDTWMCVADENQLENTILNLSINARDAMPDGGRLELAVSNAVVDARQARSLVDALPGDYVRLSVRDTGTGMPDHVRQRVFEPFFTTKAQGRGTGLGLSMVYGFVKQSGGFLHIDSRPGRGTEFQVYLPRADI